MIFICLNVMYGNMYIYNDIALLPVLLRTISKFHYGLLRTVTFPCAHPVLLRPTRFLIRTVAAVANFLTV